MSREKIRQDDPSRYAPARKRHHKWGKVNRLDSNCALVAIKEITGASDEAVIEAFELSGMKVGKQGASHDIIRQAAARLGVKLSGEIMVARPFKAGVGWGAPPTIMNAIEQHGGEYLVFTGSYASNIAEYKDANGYDGAHVFLVKNRKVIDPNSNNNVLKTTLVDFIWKVERK